jgi:hypothetical protein
LHIFQAGQSEYSVEVVVSYENDDGTSTIQSFLAQCVNQRIRYETENIPRRIEEALEEYADRVARMRTNASSLQIETCTNQGRTESGRSRLLNAYRS